MYGYFDSEEKAIKAREEAEEKYFKPILEKYNTTIYRKSIALLQKQSRYITRSEWDKIATKEKLLSSKTLEFASGKSLREIVRENEKEAD